jgi:hypothetical protein
MPAAQPPGYYARHRSTSLARATGGMAVGQPRLERR